MTSPVESWVILLLSVCLNVSALNSFPDKMVVGEMHGSVTLTCDTDFGGTVTWKHTLGDETEEVEESDYIKVSGRSLTLNDLDTPMAGNYNCWGDGTRLDYTYLLLDVTKEVSTESLQLECWAETYSCSFFCNWTHTDFTSFQLRNERDGGSWVSPSPAGVFLMKHSTDPYAEEAEPLLVTAMAINSAHYLQTSRSFHLHDIVQPALPQKVHCKVDGQYLKVGVEPPSSWATPLSYFPLEHEIEYQYRDNGKEERCLGCRVPVKISKLRVRSRDALLPSTWSQWTPWKNVQKKKGEKKGEKKGREENVLLCRKKRKGMKAKSLSSSSAL